MCPTGMPMPCALRQPPGWVSQYSRNMNPTLIGKMVTSLVSLTFFMILSQRKLAEGVDAGRYQDDVLLAFHAVQAIERVVESVEDIGLGESRNAQLVQRAVDRLLVLREVHQNVRLHVVIRHRDPVVLLQRVRERVRGLQSSAS